MLVIIDIDVLWHRNINLNNFALSQNNKNESKTSGQVFRKWCREKENFEFFSFYFDIVFIFLSSLITYSWVIK